MEFHTLSKLVVPGVGAGTHSFFGSGDAAGGCDATGACVYPTVPCGAASCDNTTNKLTQSNCDGAGTCAEGTAVDCPNHFKCQGASACFTTCTSTLINCVTGFYCDPATSQCLTPGPTGPCATPRA